MATSMATLEDIMARLGATMEETRREWHESRQETERVLAESRQEADRALTESRKELERELAESRKKAELELAESRKETERELAESRKKTDEIRRERDRAFKELAEQQKITERNLDRLSEKVDRVTGNVGGLNNDVGEIVEMVIIPGVMEKMNELEYNFSMTSCNKKFKESGKILAEVDLLLENCKEVMMVEIKMRVTKESINDHIKRLNLLRGKEKITGLTGKTVYAAIAGIKIDKQACEFAASTGMYLIEIDEEKERIKVIQPPGKAGTW